MTLSYGTLFLFLCGWLIFQHLYNPVASRLSKTIVVILSSTAVLLRFFAVFPFLPAIIVLGLAIYIYLYRIVVTPEKSPSTDGPFEKRTDL
jgi:hypothetical protein